MTSFVQCLCYAYHEARPTCVEKGLYIIPAADYVLYYTQGIMHPTKRVFRIVLVGVQEQRGYLSEYGHQYNEKVTSEMIPRACMNAMYIPQISLMKECCAYSTTRPCAAAHEARVPAHFPHLHDIISQMQAYQCNWTLHDHEITLPGINPAHAFAFFAITDTIVGPH